MCDGRHGGAAGEGVVDPAAEHRSDRGADQQGASDVTLGVWGQPEVLRHPAQGAVDHRCRSGRAAHQLLRRS